MPADLTIRIAGEPAPIYLGENTTEAKRQADRAAGFADDIAAVTGEGGAAAVDYDGRSVEQVLAELEYQQSGGLSITSFTVTPSQIETGDAQDVTAAWTIAGTITGQTIEGVAVTPISDREEVFSAVSATNEYNLYVEDTGAPGGTASDTATATVTVLQKGHAGTINKTSGITSSEVNGMSQSWYASGITRTLSFTTAEDGYLWYSQPASQADPSTFKLGGFTISPTQTTRTHTNAHGEPASYKDFLLSDFVPAGTAVVLEVIA